MLTIIKIPTQCYNNYPYLIGRGRAWYYWYFFRFPHLYWCMNIHIYIFDDCFYFFIFSNPNLKIYELFSSIINKRKTLDLLKWESYNGSFFDMPLYLLHGCTLYWIKKKRNFDGRLMKNIETMKFLWERKKEKEIDLYKWTVKFTNNYIIYYTYGIH